MFVERTPFYAESGGQVGDTGTIESETGRAHVLATDRPLEGIIRHRVRLEEGTLVEGQEANLRVDETRRDAIRRSHTATHLLHWALRTTFGSQLQQQGSLVEPDYLRFDFNHHSQLSDEDVARIEELVLGDILSDEPVQTTESTLEAARAEGAMSFFGDKYGEIVRVVRAGEHSVELCGGTHVSALGRIGGFVVRSESSVGANLRRIEALTGKAAHEDHRRARGLLHTAAESLHVAPDSVPEAIARLQTHTQPGGTPAQGAGRQRRPRTGGLTCRLCRRGKRGGTVGRSRPAGAAYDRGGARRARRDPRRGPDRLARWRGGCARGGIRGGLRRRARQWCAPLPSSSAVVAAARTGGWPSAAGAT